MAVVLRSMRSGDVPAVAALERASFTAPWTQEMIAGEVGQELGWATVAVDEEQRIAGYLVGRRYPDVWHLMDVAVVSGRRRQGLGGRLVRSFIAAAEAAAKGVLLEVRRTNTEAVALYEAEGFAVVGVRDRYYSDTGDDALVMARGPLGSGRDAPLGRGGRPLLAIESSCDDSAAAVVDAGGQVLSSVTHSQDAIHERYGGVVPEVASRAHVERMTAVVSEALRQAGCTLKDLGGIAATVGPGLIGALLVGVQTAKAIAWSRRLPFSPVNHLHGHLAAAWLADPSVPFPMVTLVASGGHTLLIRVDDRTSFALLGQTLDDAAGEAFDKGARLLGLGYPGGRELDELAKRGDPEAYSFPIGLKRSPRPDLSFSGVKTSLYYLLRDMSPEERVARAADVAASYRQAIVEALVSKAVQAAEEQGVKTLAVTGGVAANSLLRERLVEAGERAGFYVVVPPLSYCTDNAAMIGAAALAGPRLEYPRYLGIDASASLSLGQWYPVSLDDPSLDI